MVVLLAAFTISPALAGWNSSQETIATHRTWIYSPVSKLPKGKRGLLVVLHGCDQTNTELKRDGNLTAASDGAGMHRHAAQIIGPNAHYDYCTWENTPFGALFCPKSKHPGQYRVVSVKWSFDNADMYNRLYGHAGFDGAGSINENSGDRIAQSGSNYPKYIIQWMLKNNQRVGRAP